jgi:hypothetical protein
MIVDKYANYVRKLMWQLCGWGRVDIWRAFDFFIPKMIVDKYANYVRKLMWQLCGWGRVDICITFHKRAFDFFIPLHINLTIFKIGRL